ncbi:zonular occludens toxin family protein, partial [Neisseria sp. P0021.S004]|uniref:zonular occludens toxin family protein n=1 Tax=Neisseria sp. P0021.S004 TaxID=3436819 RepID=UPI003F7D1A5A
RKLEWTTGGAKDPESRANIREALISVYRLDKSVYGLYKSAEEHTKIRSKRSKVLYLIPIAIALLGGGLYYFSSFWKNMEKPIIEGQTAQAHIAASAASPEAQAAAAPAADDGAAGQYAAAKVQTPSEPPKPHLTEEDYQPRIAERPETAPIYDGMNKAVKVMPWPSACVKSDNGCNCYTDQGSKISEISKKTCLSYIKDGLPFNPYKTKQNEALTADSNSSVSEKPQVLTMGGKSPQNLMYDGHEDKALSNEGGKIN